MQSQHYIFVLEKWSVVGRFVRIELLAGRRSEALAIVGDVRYARPAHQMFCRAARVGGDQTRLSPTIDGDDDCFDMVSSFIF